MKSYTITSRITAAQKNKVSLLSKEYGLTTSETIKLLIETAKIN
jgi:antitoxin component of RelBE/YafQ-DinJ toxin-antitoxin module